MGRWAIVLAGGEGERIRSFIKRWLGTDTPKQYCTFCGTRSMLEHTLDRAASIVDDRRVVTVLGSGHSRFLNFDRLRGQIIVQPASRDTGPGIFLPLTYIRAHDRDATVCIFPSDQFIHPERLFVEHVEGALGFADSSHRLVLLGAPADRPETDYGWIEPGEPLGIPGPDCPRRVLSFHEKPVRSAAENWLSRGFLWNTMIMAVKLDTLWSIGWQMEPR